MLFNKEYFYDPVKDSAVKMGNIHLLLDKRDRKVANQFAEYAAYKANAKFSEFLQKLEVIEGTYEVPEGYTARIILLPKEKPQKKPSPTKP